MKKYIHLLSIKIFKYIYKKQKENHQKKMMKLNKKVLSANLCDKKIHTSSGATLAIKNENSNLNHQEKIEKIIEKYLNEPQKIFDYIKGAKTPVYKIKNANKILSFINEDEGFILPQKGLKGLYLNLILNKKITTTTPEMFVISSFNVNVYAFLYQFYNWYCYKMKLSGFENETQEQFKHVFEICETSKIDKLSYEEIINLKSAINRDIEAIDFVKKFTQKHSMQKKNLEKIKQGQKVCI